jgi:hypothetical protein
LYPYPQFLAKLGWSKLKPIPTLFDKALKLNRKFKIILTGRKTATSDAKGETSTTGNPQSRIGGKSGMSLIFWLLNALIIRTDNLLPK